MLEEVKIEKLVHGGQGLGVLKDGRKVFVWNALPGESVNVRLTKNKRDYAEGIAEEILKASTERIQPIDEAYLSTSPWQIMTIEAENKYKKEILHETFAREKVELPKFEFITVADPINYRNKMEYSFWGDEEGVHLAFFQRASHGKQIVPGSTIARSEINQVANIIVAILNKNGVRGSQLKTLVIRASKRGEVVAALFVKDEKFPMFEGFNEVCKGLVVYYSNPKSPASVVTKELYKFGSIILTDQVLNNEISYDVNSFFQVNVPVFETALAEIKKAVKNETNIIDMYSGVGTIGLCVGANKLIELDAHNIEMAKRNSANGTEIIQASTENTLEHITRDSFVIFDPPRAGLHDKVIGRIMEIKPYKIAYLSCNPSTQARDLAKLGDMYRIKKFSGYNFFPRTPHIESLAILEKSV